LRCLCDRAGFWWRKQRAAGLPAREITLQLFYPQPRNQRTRLAGRAKRFNRGLRITRMQRSRRRRGETDGRAS
jgi:hypothetical protein